MRVGATVAAVTSLLLLSAVPAPSQTSQVRVQERHVTGQSVAPIFEGWAPNADGTVRALAVTAAASRLTMVRPRAGLLPSPGCRKKASNAMAGVPVWSCDGMVCTGETYTKVVKLTFARGASIPDPSRLFNSSLEGNTRRAIDIREGEKVNAAAFKKLVKAAVARNL